MCNPTLARRANSASRALDVYVALHSFCALSFASLMLFKPQVFAYYIYADHLPPLAEDAIRWASPFAYGYGLLALLSLTMKQEEHLKVAWMYTSTLGMAVPIGCFVQSVGRWNPYNTGNIVIFAALSAGYATFIIRMSHAFHRGPRHLKQDADDEPPAFQGVSKQSLALDYFVTAHFVFAIGFAMTMLFRPASFATFIREETLPPLAEDSIRWSSPFVFGYGILAKLSLTMKAQERLKVASMYCVTLGLGCLVGCYVHGGGRWNNLHFGCILFMGALGSGYANFILKHRHAFDRTGLWLDRQLWQDEEDPRELWRYTSLGAEPAQWQDRSSGSSALGQA